MTLIQIFYRNFSSFGSSIKFTVKPGVQHGRVISAFLFTVAIANEDCDHQQHTCIVSSFEELIYADYFVLPYHTRDREYRKTNNLEQQASSIGIIINAKKTKVLTTETIIRINTDLNQ